MTRKGYRWGVVALLFTATTINYLDRQLIGLLKPVLELDFGWSETDFARIVMAFTAAYAVGLLVSGRLIDRIGTKLGFALSITVWSIAGMLHAVARGATGFILARIGLGLGEAGNFPAAVKTVAEWFPKRERALATGIFNAGTSIGVVVSLMIVPYMLAHSGWKGVFLITGALGFVWLLFWWVFYDVPERQRRLSKEEFAHIREGEKPSGDGDAAARPVRWLRLLRLRSTWAYVTGKGLIDPIYWFFLFWLPSYFASTFQLDLKKPSLELMTIYLATTVGSIFGGYFSSRLVSRGWDTLSARKFSLLIFAGLELSVILARYATSPWAAVALLSLAVAVHQAWAANVFTLAADLFPRQAVSSVVGIGGMAGAVGGILFPAFVGEVLDRYKSAGHLEEGYKLIFTLCGCTYLVALLIIHLLTRGQERVTMEDIS
ncbi:MAG: MFS transporter [Chitinophagia bacterium]|nr:MFS transporter [Chitinophagia bacterium]